MILDTSVLYDSLIDAPLSEAARALISSGTRLRSPDLILVEIAGAITRAVRRKDLDERQAKPLYASVLRVLPEIDPSALLIDRAFALSLELRHPLSDCVFLAHAESLGDSLITNDRRFVEKLKETPHARHIAALADWQP